MTCAVKWFISKNYAQNAVCFPSHSHSHTYTHTITLSLIFSFFPHPKAEAIAIGNDMMNKHLFHHVKYEHSFKNEDGRKERERERERERESDSEQVI